MNTIITDNGLLVTIEQSYASEEEIEAFTCGDCYFFAEDLEEVTGLRMVALTTWENDGQDPIFLHFMCEVSEEMGLYVDVRGVRTVEETKEEFGDYENIIPVEEIPEFFDYEKEQIYDVPVDLSVLHTVLDFDQFDNE